MKILLFILFFLPFLFSNSSFAEKSRPTEAEVLAQLQIGPTWDKIQINEQYFKQLSPTQKRAALSIANFKHGTAFFVGLFDDHFVMATNAHVAANDNKDLLPRNIDVLTSNPTSICTSSGNQSAVIEPVRFHLRNKSFACEQLIGVWPSVELALFTIKVDPADHDFFKGIGLKFDFANAPAEGAPLEMMGYGEFMNPGEPNVALMHTMGSTCRTFSRTKDFRYMPDPDEHSPGPYNVWSFANGCSVAWGDSGSPVINSSNGRVVGLIWTARYPKTAAVKDLAFLSQIAKHQSPEVWSQLSYASPALKINAAFEEDLKDSHSRGLKQNIIRAIQNSSK